MLRKDGYFMTWEFFVKYLHILAKMIKGGVFVTKRFLLLLDEHGSRIHPACVDARSGSWVLSALIHQLGIPSGSSPE